MPVPKGMGSNEEGKHMKTRKKHRRAGKVGHVPISETAKPNGDLDGELGHVLIPKSVVMKKISEIRPSPENDEIYGQFNPDHPDDCALIEDIQKRGLIDPIIVTLDGYIVSGHRRHAACLWAGIDEVPVLVANVRRGDPGYQELLTAYNKQRVKTIDEIAREELVSLNPEEAHRLLMEERQQASKVEVETIQIEGYKHRAQISDAKQPFLDAIKRVLEEREDYWPLTDRQIHYALLNDPPLIHARKPESRYTNTQQAYKSLCELVTRARLAGLIPFDAIDDPTRPIITWDVHRHPAPFIRGHLDKFLKGYYRDLLQSQPHQIEIIGEKNTIDNIIRPVAMEYRIPLTIGRGYSSLPPRHKMADRFKRSGKKQLILLVLSDFDPEGEDIAHSFARSMRDDFGIDEIVPVKVALTAEQVEELELPPQMKAKESSSRYSKFVELHGDDVFELEAVAPDRLQAILRQGIDDVLDLDLFNAEIKAERNDAVELEALRRGLHKVLGKKGLGLER